MSKKSKLSAETLSFHKRMSELFQPIAGTILIEYVENNMSSGGVVLTGEATKSICHPVVALPTDKANNERLKHLENGDWVVCNVTSFNIFTVFGRNFSFIQDFNVISKADINYLKEDSDWKAQKRQEDEEKVSKARLIVN